MTTADNTGAPSPAKTIDASVAPPAPKWADVTVTLTHPLLYGERSVTSITLREPDLEALEKLDDLGLKEDEKPTVRQCRAMIQALSREPDELLSKLHRADVLALVEAMAPLVS